jgi:cell wall-associated NlpC family hydrolase
MTLDISRHRHSRDPQDEPTVRQVQTLLGQKALPIKVDGEFGPQSERATRRFQAKTGLQQDGIVGRITWSHLSSSHLSSQPPPALRARSRTSSAAAGRGGTTGRAVAALGYKIVTGGFGARPRYVFGAENNVFRPAQVHQTDCSELCQVVVSTLTGHAWIDGSGNQFAACHQLPVAEALHTPGALLFVSSNGHVSGVHHVAISLGDGRTAEARNHRMGCGVWSARGRFNLAGLIPGISY